MPSNPQPSTLLLLTLLVTAGLILVIAKCKLHAFVALALASLGIGLLTGMNLSSIAQAFQEGVGLMLGSVAAVVGLGMIIGKMLTQSGGAEVIAQTLIQALKGKHLQWTMLGIGLVVGIPVFFTVGVVLLIPILLTIQQNTRLPLLYLGIPLISGLSVMHGLVPPHPGPMAAIGITQADPGKVIFYSFLVGLPTAVIAGPVFGSLVSRKVTINPRPLTGRSDPSSRASTAPTFGLTVVTITLPVLLMLSATVANLAFPKGNPLRTALEFAGHPLVAMLAATLFSYYSFGLARGFNRQQLLTFTEECLAPAASILLVVGAGGGFNRVLVVTGVGDALAGLAKSIHLSPLLLGWLVAASIRIATGSATVAITTAAGLITPLAKLTPGTNMELFVLAMGAGSLILSHVNDGGFWFVKEYFGMSVGQTLQSWTVMETVISIAALVFVLLLDVLV